MEKGRLVRLDAGKKYEGKTKVRKKGGSRDKGELRA